MAFTYRGDLADSLDYARYRLDDTNEDDPFLPDETYLALFERFGVREGMAQAAGAIALNLSKRISSFGEAAGVRFTKANLDYYQKLPGIIRAEPPYDADEAAASAGGVRVGAIKRGVNDTYWHYRRVEQYPKPCPPES